MKNRREWLASMGLATSGLAAGGFAAGLNSALGADDENNPAANVADKTTTIGRSTSVIDVAPIPFENPSWEGTHLPSWYELPATERFPIDETTKGG